LIEALLLLLLLSLGVRNQPGKKESGLTVVSLKANEVSEEKPEPTSRERAQSAKELSAPQPPATPEPVLPRAAEVKVPPIAPAILQKPLEQPAAAETPPTTRPAPPTKRAYGPPDSGGSSASRDSERVGTAPNGQPLYAAAWYREPTDDELRGYLSTASGPGWGLIACRTAPNYRVEDCVALDEYPHGSQINRAVLAAAWEFKVRPPRLGGQPLVGSWVRIRIDYGTRRR
jgi:protein TonB